MEAFNGGSQNEGSFVFRFLQAKEKEEFMDINAVFLFWGKLSYVVHEFVHILYTNMYFCM